MYFKEEKGTVPILVLFATLGLLLFIFVTNTFDFKNNLFSTLFPKPPSFAISSTDTSYNMGVLVIKYFPLTSDGQNIDITVTGDVGDPYTTIKQRTVDITNNLVTGLSKASIYLGYKNSTASPSLTYQITDTKEYTQAVPTKSTPVPRYPDYPGIMSSHNICDYVDNKNVREVWLWAYQGGAKSDGYPYLSISESKMSGPFGDISNSPRYNDMPACKNTYRVYTFNYGRGTSEAMESWGHQIEAEVDAINSSFFRSFWQGPNYPQTLGVNGRCGSVHNPPNARFEYDRNNPNPQKSDCLDWNPDSPGTLSDISCQNWGCGQISDNNNPALNYMVWNWQNLPGRNNTKTYQGNLLRNFWDAHGDFDKVMGSDRTLFLTIPKPPPAITVSDSFDRADSSSLGNATTGQSWSVAKGSWGITSNQAYSIDGCPAPGYALIDSGSKNGYVQVSLTVNRQDMRLPFRFQDLNNLYWLENRGSFYDINKMVAGVRSIVASSTGITPADGDVIKIDLDNSLINVYINGTGRISTTDSEVSGTKHGIGTWCNGAIRYDNFSIATPTATPSPAPSPDTTTTPTPSPSPIATPTPTPTPNPLDTTPPKISITNPSGTTVNTASKINIQATASDNVKISKVEFYVNGSNKCTIALNLTSYTCTWSVPGKKNTQYAISAKAYDTSNNTQSASVTVTAK